MTDEEADWSVAFSIPADTPGIKQVVRITTPRPRKHIHTKHFYGVADSTTIFDDVFVPWERVFLCGEDLLCQHPGDAFCHLSPPQLHWLQAGYYRP